MKAAFQFITLFLAFHAATVNAQELSIASKDGVKIAYDVRGEGPALVLVHGWSCDRSYWSGQVDELSRKYKVVTLDLAGHGASGQGRTDYTIELFSADVVAVINALKLRDVILAGHSMGGDVIVVAAKQLNETVKGLILVDSYNDLVNPGSPEEVKAFVNHMREDFPEKTRTFVRRMFRIDADSALVEKVANDMASAPPAIALSSLENALTYRPSIAAVLKEIGISTVAINADNDPTDIASMKRYGVGVEIMKGTGHFLMMEDPERFNEIFETAIARLRRVKK